MAKKRKRGMSRSNPMDESRRHEMMRGDTARDRKEPARKVKPRGRR